MALFELKLYNFTADRYGICSSGGNGIYPIPSRASQGMVLLKVCDLLNSDLGTRYGWLSCHACSFSMPVWYFFPP